jgi:phosphoglycolate phosphatase-like HAD superfamily hydrolase
MTNRYHIRLLITDLDNTLYDWLSYFVPAFYGMVEVAAKQLSVDREQLLDELKIIHQYYHNSEHPFALLETPTVERLYAGSTRMERRKYLKDAFDAFNRIRLETLHLYPGVRETLHTIRRSGCTVVGYTEAAVENSLYRLKLLNITEEFQRLYAPESTSQGHPDPTRPAIEAEFQHLVYLLPRGHRKPNPAVIKDICEHHKVSGAATLYVGDSLTRDVAMAKAAGVHAVWARYGTSYDPATWEKLVRVTHWTAEDRDREQLLKEQYRAIHPDVTINSFSDLLNEFEFTNDDALNSP